MPEDEDVAPGGVGYAGAEICEGVAVAGIAAEGQPGGAGRGQQAESWALRKPEAGVHERSMCAELRGDERAERGRRVPD